MGIPSKQIGWSSESNLLYYILKQLEQLTGIAGSISGGGGSQNLQSVLDIGDTATKELSIANILSGSPDNRDTYFTSTDGIDFSSIRVLKDQTYLSSVTPTLSTGIGISAGKIYFSESEIVSGNSTTVGLDPSIANTIINFPGKEAGNYTVAMTSDIIDNNWRRVNGLDYFNDFIGPGLSDITTGLSDMISQYTNFGAGSSNSPVKGANLVPNELLNNVGILQQSTGTTNTGSAGFITMGGSVSGGVIKVAGGEIIIDVLIEVETLSTLGERFTILTGLLFSYSTAPIHAISFVYDEGGLLGLSNNTASPNWQTSSRDNNVTTVSNTGVPVVTTGFVKLKIIINAAGTSVGFYINNVLVSTHNTNIPTGNSKKLMFVNVISKQTGIINRNMFTDYVYFKQSFTTPRN